MCVLALGLNSLQRGPQLFVIWRKYKELLTWYIIYLFFEEM